MTYLILFLSVAAGVIVARFLAKDRRKVRLLTAFGGAYVFTITILHLFPEVYESGKPGIGWFVLLGFFLQIFLEYFSHGIEHGHAHHEHGHGRVPLGVMMGLCVHAFLEGMPLGGSGWGLPKTEANRMLLAGIVMHNVPVSVVLHSMLAHNELSRSRVLGLMFLFAAMSPLGAMMSGALGAVTHYEAELTAVVIGIFLHLSTTILFEASEAHRFNQQKIIGILAGAAVAVASTMIH